MHPAKNLVVHVDLLRVVPNEKIRIRLPIHFKGEAVSPGVKVQGGVVSHRLSDVEVLSSRRTCRSTWSSTSSAMNLNETKFLSDMPVPEGVEIDRSGGRQEPAGGLGAQPACGRAGGRCRSRACRGRCCSSSCWRRACRRRERRTTRPPPLLRRRKAASSAPRGALRFECSFSETMPGVASAAPGIIC